jgi:putative endonuclease
MKKRLNNRVYGKIGEDIATHYLIDKGYEIITRNFQIWGGEIDIIAKLQDSYIFVEVKTRTSEGWQDIEDSLTAKKIAFITNAAEEWFLKNNMSEPFWQIDFIGIILTRKHEVLKIEHLEDIQ